MQRELGHSERIFYYLDINVTVLVKLTEMLDIDAARIAAEKTFNQHPLSQSTIVSQNGNLFFNSDSDYYYFNVSEDQVESILSEETRHPYPENSHLARITYVINTEGNFLIFCFSHTISDGRGALNFINDFFNYYQDNEIMVKCLDELPLSIEDCSNIKSKPEAIKQKNHDNKSSHQKYSFLTIDHKGSLVKLLNQFSSTSMTASLAAIFLKAFGDTINDNKPDLYLTLDLRSVLEIDQYNLAFYSVGIAGNYSVEQPLADLVRAIQHNLMKLMSDQDFQEKAMSHSFGITNDLHFSYINNPIIKKLEKNNLIGDIKFIGNACLPDTYRKQVFILVVNFRNKLNITICYDDRIIDALMCENMLHTSSVLLEQRN